MTKDAEGSVEMSQIRKEKPDGFCIRRHAWYCGENRKSKEAELIRKVNQKDK